MIWMQKTCFADSGPVDKPTLKATSVPQGSDVGTAAGAQVDSMDKGRGMANVTSGNNHDQGSNVALCDPEYILSSALHEVHPSWARPASPDIISVIRVCTRLIKQSLAHFPTLTSAPNAHVNSSPAISMPVQRETSAGIDDDTEARGGRGDTIWPMIWTASAAERSLSAVFVSALCECLGNCAYILQERFRPHLSQVRLCWSRIGTFFDYVDDIARRFCIIFLSCGSLAMLWYRRQQIWYLSEWLCTADTQVLLT